LQFTGDLVRTDLTEKARKKNLKLLKEAEKAAQLIDGKEVDPNEGKSGGVVANLISAGNASSSSSSASPSPQLLTPSGKPVVQTGGYVRRGSTGSKGKQAIHQQPINRSKGDDDDDEEEPLIPKKK